jgi:hypothetical protein
MNREKRRKKILCLALYLHSKLGKTPKKSTRKCTVAMMMKELQNKKIENHGSSSMLSNKTNSENNCCTLSRKRSQLPISTTNPFKKRLVWNPRILASIPC